MTWYCIVPYALLVCFFVLSLYSGLDADGVLTFRVVQGTESYCCSFHSLQVRQTVLAEN